MSQPGPAHVVVQVIRRDLLIVLRRRADAMTTVLFFVIVTSLFPLGIGPEPTVLRVIGPGVLWVAALLSCLLSLNRLFTADHQDGVLEQLVLLPQPLSVIVLAKVAAHWLISGLPVVVLSPLLGVQYGLTGEALGILTFSLLLGTPTLSFIGSIGAALTLGVRGSGVLVALLALPLFIPVLIFGAGAVSNHLSGIGAGANLSLLGASLLLALVLAPWATSAALRLAVE
jgi:heme exporter protein B